MALTPVSKSGFSYVAEIWARKIGFTELKGGFILFPTITYF
jgi:hypothetical protein